jgi:hypothetical protein
LARENGRGNKKKTANTKSAFKPEFLSLLNFIAICVYLSRELFGRSEEPGQGAAM